MLYKVILPIKDLMLQFVEKTKLISNTLMISKFSHWKQQIICSNFCMWQISVHAPAAIKDFCFSA